MSDKKKELLSAAELVALTDRVGWYSTKGTMRFRVQVKDARQGFGRLDLLVAPVEGTGEAWISSEFITLDEQ